jgi:ActR/RegA family two-component response regulator
MLSSCAEAWAWLVSNVPAVAIVDIQLRDGPCDDIVQALTDRRIPFVVHSGATEPISAANAYAAGVWLSKPSTDRDIVASVAAAVGAGTPNL